MADCSICRFKINLSGTHHIGCCNPDKNIKGNERAILKGWFIYPFNFDPIWIENECRNYVDMKLSEFEHYFGILNDAWTILLKRQKEAYQSISINYDSNKLYYIDKLMEDIDVKSSKLFEFFTKLQLSSTDIKIINDFDFEKIKDLKKCYDFFKNFKKTIAKV